MLFYDGYYDRPSCINGKSRGELPSLCEAICLPLNQVECGIYSSTRQAIKGPAVVDGKKLYIYPEQYEGQECDPLIFCTGPVPAQQVEPLIPWLMQQTG